MKKIVCLTGVSGGVGQTLLKHLSERFYVKALFRQECALSEKWKKQGCQIIVGDLRDEESLKDLVAGTEFVFHCAALLNSFSLEEANEVNVEGTRRLAHAAAMSGCKRFIHLSSVAVYSGTSIKGHIYTERVQIKENPGMDIYSLTKLRSEVALREVASIHGLEYVILRPTYIYGPAVKTYTMTPWRMIQKGLPLVVGDGKGILDVVYVNDVARAMILAAHSREAVGEIFNLGGEKITCQEFFSYYERMAQQPVCKVPKWAANLGVSLAGIHPEFGKTLKWYIAILNSSREYPSTKAKALLGYTPQFPLLVGMSQTESWLRANHYIPAQHHVSRRVFQSLLGPIFPHANVNDEKRADLTGESSSTWSRML